MIKYTCQNFANGWNIFPQCMKKMMEIIFPEEEFVYVNLGDKPDIDFVTVFNTERLNHEIPKCYVIHENILLDWLTPARNAIRNLNIPIIGYINDTDMSCEYPHWLYKYDEIIADNEYKSNKQRKNKVCSVIRNHKSEDRENIVKFYESDELNNDGEWGSESKYELIYKYFYNIAVENSYVDYYITEKVYDAVIAGCIPIYKGGNLNNTILNEDRIIEAYDELPKSPQKIFNLPILKPKDIVEEMFETRKNKLREFIMRILNSKQ